MWELAVGKAVRPRSARRSKDTSWPDLGCGQGRLARKLAEAGNEVVAVDLSEELLTIATNAGRAHITYIHGDACSRDWWDGTQFDAVGFALEAVEEPPWASPPGLLMPFFFVSRWRRL